MPLVRVSGKNAESFDTFDVAEMTDNRNQHSQHNSWSSRQTSGGGGTTPANSWYSRHTLSPTPETDDLTSIDSSSGGRRSEEAARVGSIPSCRGSIGRDGMSRLSQSSNSVGSMNSHHTNATSLSLSENSEKMPNSSYGSYTSNSYNSNAMYDTIDNLDDMEHDPRNPFNKANNALRDGWGDRISEEDETSICTMEDSSVTPSVQQQPQYQTQNSRPNAPNRSHRQRQRQPYDSDDVSISSHQSRQDFNKRKTNNDHIIQQLESQVAKINFDLATTKSSLDEVQLENRRLTDDKENLSKNMTLLQKENEQLHLKIERMEKEIILRNMEGTKGVVHSSTDLDSSWGRDGGTSVASSCKVYVPVTKRKLEKEGEPLEVPFRSSSDGYRLRPNRSSLCSQSSFHDVYSDDEGASRGENDCRSVSLNENEDLRNSLLSADGEDAALKGRLNLLNMIGGGIKPTVSEITKQVKEAAISFPTNKNSGAGNESENSSQSTPTTNLVKLGSVDSDDIGSNPQGEGEDFNDDDPFSTWSAPGDPKRKESEQNWLRRGLGGKGVDTKSSQQIPQPNEIMEDPFDSCNDGHLSNIDETDNYTSFADNTCEKSEDGDIQDKKRFGLFKGFMGRGRKSE